MQSARAIQNITAMESSGTSDGSPTKVYEHSFSLPWGIPQETISSTRQQLSVIWEVPVSSSIATATITRTGWCSTAGGVTSHTGQCIDTLANDKRIFFDDTMVRECCIVQNKTKDCVENDENVTGDQIRKAANLSTWKL